MNAVNPSADTPPADAPADAPAGFNEQKTCRHGRMLFNRNDRYIGRSLSLYGEFAEGEMDFFRQIVRPGDVVLDVGANVGTHTLFFARQVGSAGKVLAFEPQRVIFQTLCANVALNSITNVWCYPEAVGGQAGELFVPPLDYDADNNFGGIALEAAPMGERVPVVTLDSLNLSRCNVIKIDVEGMEQAVIHGGRNTIVRSKPHLYVENDRRDRSAELIGYLRELGYALYWHRPRLYNPRNYFANPENIFRELVSINMLCVHQTAAVRIIGLPAVG